MENLLKQQVCIVTYYKSNNYGTNLQAIGLATQIKNMGYDVSFVGQFKEFGFMAKHPLLLYARILNKLKRNEQKSFFNPVPYSISPERSGRLEGFRQRNYIEKSFHTEKEWKKALENRVVFVSGSDIIWNPANGYPAKYFLDFAYYAKLPRFSYATSIGALELPKEYYKAYRRYLGSMVEVGVREESVAKMLEPIIGRKVTKVVDPSLLLSREDWDKFANQAELSLPISQDGFVLCYFVMNDPRYWEYVKTIKKETGLQIIVLPMHTLDEQQPYDIILDGTPCEFLWLIKNAAFVCTDSFHACAVSLIYQKEFYLLRRTRKAEDAKYDDFLNRYHLADRAVTDEGTFERKTEIDFTYAEKKLEEDRIDSLEFLKKALEECEN